VTAIVSSAARARVAGLLGLAALAAAGPLRAQEPGEPGRVRVWRTPSGDKTPAPGEYLSIVMARRARLGITLNLRARETDSIGAYVAAVTPGGPAAKAGIRSGDVITKLDGTSLVSNLKVDGRNYGPDRSLPGLRLIELTARLGPSDTVAVELRRGQGWKERRTVKVVTEAEPDDFALRGEGPGRTFMFRTPGGAGFMDGAPRDLADLEMAGDRHGFSFAFGSPLGNLELASMNPDLGPYFGTDDGVLVVSAPKEGKLNLKGGDVILSVDGRKVASPSQLMRILRSYEEDESFKLEVLRNRRRETVTGSLGDQSRPR
jgi:membrane-associated protease RseP (regulator of RpoE activity)